MDSFDRGDTLQWNVTFTDVNGNATMPSGARLKVTYYTKASRLKTTDTIEMTAETDQFVASWDSGVAYPGIVSWFTESEDAFVSGDQDQFILTANDANT